MEGIEKTLAISIRGASHFESGKPVQDYSLAVSGNNISIAVVCDGHGADKHFRSEIGSELAAHATKDKMLDFCKQYPTWDKAEPDLTAKINRLKVAIISAWQEGIEKYTAEHPFTEEELKKASASFSLRKDYDVAQPYGTTILAALISNDYYLVLMIGDGAIAKINSDFNSSIVTFSGKHIFDDQPHSATDSLCEIDSYNKIFSVCERIADGESIAFALCSDGMSEAFSSDDILLKKFNNYLNYYAEEGLEKASAAIEAQLNELSRISPMKDDISLAFATISLEKFDKREENAAKAAAQQAANVCTEAEKPSETAEAETLAPENVDDDDDDDEKDIVIVDNDIF